MEFDVDLRLLSQRPVRKLQVRNGLQMDGSYEENLSLIDIYVICYTKIYKMIFSQPNLANKFHLLKRKNTCLFKFSNSSHFFFLKLNQKFLQIEF